MLFLQNQLKVNLCKVKHFLLLFIILLSLNFVFLYFFITFAGLSLYVKMCFCILVPCLLWLLFYAFVLFLLLSILIYFQLSNEPISLLILHCIRKIVRIFLKQSQDWTYLLVFSIKLMPAIFFEGITGFTENCWFRALAFVFFMLPDILFLGASFLVFNLFFLLDIQFMNQIHHISDVNVSFQGSEIFHQLVYP